MNICTGEIVVLKVNAAAVGFKTRRRGGISLDGVDSTAFAVQHDTDVADTAAVPEEDEITGIGGMAAAKLAVAHLLELSKPLRAADLTPNVVDIARVIATPIILGILRGRATLEQAPRNKASAPCVCRAAVAVRYLTHVVVILGKISGAAAGSTRKRAVGVSLLITEL